MPEVTAVEGTRAITTDDVAPESPKPRFAPPSRRPLDGFGNALTTAVEIVVVTALGYVFGHRLGGAIGGGLGMTLGAVASFVRLYYRVGHFESPLSRIKGDTQRKDGDGS